eukprot:m.143963 g.143963  ORF g.143963 m.143963 type:complete len:72 (+) comp14906_c0_seq22:1428-1643(+)
MIDLICHIIIRNVVVKRMESQLANDHGQHKLCHLVLLDFADVANIVPPMSVTKRLVASSLMAKFAIGNELH